MECPGRRMGQKTIVAWKAFQIIQTFCMKMYQALERGMLWGRVVMSL